MKKLIAQLIMIISKAFKSAPLRIKLVTAYSFLFVVVLLLSSGTLYFFTKKNIEQNIESELRNSTMAILNMVQTAANLSIRTHLQAIAIKNKEILTGLHQKVLTGDLTQREAKKQATQILLSQKIGDTGYIYCVNSKGVLQVHPKPSLIGKNISEYLFVQKQLKKKADYIEYDWQNPGDSLKRSKALYMTYFKPWDWIISASSYREEFKDLISAEDFSESIMTLRFGETGYSYVIDVQGNLIIHPGQPNTNIYDSRDTDGRYFIRQMIQQKNGQIIYPWKNPGETVPRKKLVIFNDLPEYKMIVASSSYLEEFYRPLTIIRYISIASAVIAIFLLMPFTMWIGNLIARPLKRAANQFLSAGKGDFSIRMEIQSGDEIGRMATGFNSFMARLEHYRDELEDLNENLETRVQERTLELKKSLDDVKKLKGLLPICSGCKKIRDDSGYWQQIESYISKHSDADFSHGICPDCIKKLFPDIDLDDEKTQ